jgi:hypothetical protein
MALAQTNTPFGKRYNATMGQWLTKHGLAEVTG